MRRFALAVISLAALLTTEAVAAGLSAGLFEEREPASRTTAADYDSMVFKSEGAEIYGQVLKPDASFGGARPCVMIFHGFAGFARFDDIGQALCRAGCVVVIPHHRGAWGSQGKYSVTHCIEDAVNLVRYARSEEFACKYRSDTNLVFLVGHSMGGNTVLNAAGRAGGVRGIVMLDPCDIGYVATSMSGAAFRAFMVENGAEVLQTDGVDAVCRDILDHSREYLFPNAAARLRGAGVFWIEAKWGLDEDGGRRKAFLKAAGENRFVPLCKWESYPCNHGLMGCRLRATRAIADFISLLSGTDPSGAEERYKVPRKSNMGSSPGLGK